MEQLPRELHFTDAEFFRILRREAGIAPASACVDKMADARCDSLRSDRPPRRMPPYQLRM
jgi:hypothetical protein